MSAPEATLSPVPSASISLAGGLPEVVPDEFESELDNSLWPIFASLRVCVPPGMTLEQWERTEGGVRGCFLLHGVTHVATSPQHFRGCAA
ncbi:hypothetical protein B0H15DRAFT_948489 [Mycena belliarum]|uniref:Uncharacterized protein n=1 Tax=Mycena belliarum TaxID=1033014 RepID=A0AAD6XQB8_9AGAR|nr:hypothetical protein B0H15DRAFT_948489 [Mycena belliae]